MIGEHAPRWTPEQAGAWYDVRPWLCGSNYVPCTAVNSLEMWQAETFDPRAIVQELDWAQRVNLNACRVYLPFLLLPFLLWQRERDG